MPQVFVQVDGIQELKTALAEFSEKGKTVMHEAVNKGAEALRPKIQSAIKIGSDDDVHLRYHIKIKKAKAKKTVKQYADIVIGTASADYGFHLETGHITKSGRHVPARPYIRSTTDRESEDIAGMVVDHILDRMGV